MKKRPQKLIHATFCEIRPSTTLNDVLENSDTKYPQFGLSWFVDNVFFVWFSLVNMRCAWFELITVSHTHSHSLSGWFNERISAVHVINRFTKHCVNEASDHITRIAKNISAVGKAVIDALTIHNTTQNDTIRL